MERGGIMSEIRNKAISGIETGDVFSVSRMFLEEDVVQFADISKDYNPVHFDKQFAKQKKFDQCICHGLLIGSILTEIGGQIGWLGTQMAFSFEKPVYLNDTITCTFTVQAISKNRYAKAKAVFTNQNEVVVLSATLEGILPNDKEKTIMSRPPIISKAPVIN